MTDEPAREPEESIPAEPVRAEPREAEVLLVPIARRPWGAWATAGWSALCLVAIVVVQNVVAVAFLIARSQVGPQADPTALSSSGLVLALATLTGAPVGLGLIALLVRVRGWRVRDYLALAWPARRQALVALALMVLLIAASDGLTYLLGRPVVPEVMVEAYQTAGSLPLFLAALLIGAPLWEEALFRGFAFRGIAASRAGPAWAIILTALAWSVIHVQYDAFQMSLVFAGGLYLGLVRQVTGSTLLTMALHAVWNAIATAEVAIHIHRLG